MRILFSTASIFFVDPAASGCKVRIILNDNGDVVPATGDEAERVRRLLRALNVLHAPWEMEPTRKLIARS